MGVCVYEYMCLQCVSVFPDISPAVRVTDHELPSFVRREHSSLVGSWDSAAKLKDLTVSFSSYWVTNTKLLSLFVPSFPPL